MRVGFLLSAVLFCSGCSASTQVPPACSYIGTSQLADGPAIAASPQPIPSALPGPGVLVSQHPRVRLRLPGASVSPTPGEPPTLVSTVSAVGPEPDQRLVEIDLDFGSAEPPYAELEVQWLAGAVSSYQLQGPPGAPSSGEAGLAYLFNVYETGTSGPYWTGAAQLGTVTAVSRRDGRLERQGPGQQLVDPDPYVMMVPLMLPSDPVDTPLSDCVY